MIYIEDADINVFESVGDDLIWVIDLEWCLNLINELFEMFYECIVVSTLPAMVYYVRLVFSNVLLWIYLYNYSYMCIYLNINNPPTISNASIAN